MKALLILIATCAFLTACAELQTDVAWNADGGCRTSSFACMAEGPAD